jgi:hypothetical protein
LILAETRPEQLVTVDLSSGVAVMVIGLTLLISLVFYLITNLSPCGLITPAYLVLSLVRSPWALSAVLGVTAVLWAVVTLANKKMILYGKRLFAMTMSFGVILNLAVYVPLYDRMPFLFPTGVLSSVVPGLIVYQLVRQKKPMLTLAITGAVSAFSAAVVFTALALP